MKFRETLFIIILVGLFLIPAALIKQWWLFFVFLAFFFSFGLIEWASSSKTGLTVSQHFWEYSKNHKVQSWLVLLSMLIAWIFLLIHFASRYLI